MAKEKLKKKLGLKTDPSLTDVDRIVPKLEGGDYLDLENVRLMDPVEHMRRHGIHRIRPEDMDHLKTLYDDRRQTIRGRIKIQNQLKAYERRVDHCNPEVAEFLESTVEPFKERQKRLDKEISKIVEKSEDTFIQVALRVPGVGPITVGLLSVYVDLNKAEYASHMWSYVGLHKPSHLRFQKDEEQMARRKARGADFYGGKGGIPTGWGGNKTIRSQLYVMASNMIRLAGKGVDMPYAVIYGREKARLEASKKIVKSRNTKGDLVEVEWRNTKPSHRHGAAMRKMIKHFLADYWFVGRDLLGLPTRPLYVEEKLGHSGIIRPEEMGWKWKK